MSHVRAQRPDYLEPAQITSRTSSYIETATEPGPALDQTGNLDCELRGQDFSVQAGYQINQPRRRCAETDVFNAIDFNTTDASAIIRRARVEQAKELRRLFTAAVARGVDATARWAARNKQRRHLGNLPDYLLRDIGIRRDEINDVVSGNLKRGKGQ